MTKLGKLVDVEKWRLIQDAFSEQVEQRLSATENDPETTSEHLPPPPFY